MAKHFPIKPANPERICWGCDRYCPADSLQCGNGSIATPHPSELFGDDWMAWGLDAQPATGSGDRVAQPQVARLPAGAEQGDREQGAGILDR